MNDGGGESRRNIDECKSERGGEQEEDEFGRAVTRVSVAQICESAGYHTFQRSALEALADIALRYLRDLGRSARFHANLAGRTACNVFDVIQALEDLGSSQGFAGASDVNHPLAASGALKDIIRYTNIAEEIPFARAVPRFPIPKTRKPTPSFLQLGETPPHKHIPSWLPAFPDPHTYIHTPVWNERGSDPRTEKLEQARQRRKAEKSLVSLQQRLACNGATMASMDGELKGKRPLDGNNPFLAPPLLSGEKEASLVPMPAGLSLKSPDENIEKKPGGLSVVNAFAPANEAAKGGGLIDEARQLKPKRPVVQFKFGLDKRTVNPAPLLFGNRYNRTGGNATDMSWFSRDEEKDDKKKRAEQILKEAMENPQELVQL
ncbi:hypothetical protein AMTRI_Chr10g1710 [Amborella trichopoda]|uniref:Transcription initiation factor TFIID subunit 8 n=1 Tax=Amborella trichopoda TaxID=13333 RepID=W1PHT0_AMBTC|nr:transcription initiation factor TFIID subunit 8 [Amborella trichopoda]XP_011623971.1 transcription initiation factor TFIID subunit 8 [Amborella trichopoda]XP_020523849.1 transcription initiation factor TFIID subunit 8 [Amborella trichopoda]XP_020523850.1 transcription initiation factor TFIID subunit 8 [Amborella trichopoda]XP_020523851.1 transcription initiation factor TFIID subunit 8 [Amborella trichopoda]ERN07558.1 hypothetical protein AMTR_s00154p00079940 [Amborella trichopoda]|eukprot:XP_006845883.1 transcription initiation factor TFIID subunit 8 [Amborella trichopoda]